MLEEYKGKEEELVGLLEDLWGEAMNYFFTRPTIMESVYNKMRINVIDT